MQTNHTPSTHLSVMTEEVMTHLDITKDHWYLDATFGGGGHTRRILEAGGKVLALDHDQAAINAGQETFTKEIASEQLILEKANFKELDRILTKYAHTTIEGSLFDFGTSTDQLMSQERGFSFQGNGPLDMRMDTTLGVTAADLLAALGEKQLTEMFVEYGGERYDIAKQVAKQIVQQRTQQPITSTAQLISLVEKATHRQGKLHPATKIFQALRIIVNDELTNIKQALPKAITITQDVIITIAFHEGEDRLAKHTFKEAEQAGKGTLLPLIQPTESEIKNNPRARSAKLRVFKKNI